MCGILGVVKVGRSIELQRWKDAVSALFKFSEERGKEASGAAFIVEDGVKVLKCSEPSSVLVGRADFLESFEGMNDHDCFSLIGHSRLVTSGMEFDDGNNQPVKFGNVCLVHNGIIVDYEDVWKSLGVESTTDLDSEVIAALIDSELDKGILTAVENALNTLVGEVSIAGTTLDSNKLFCATNTGSLYYCASDKDGVFVFASEKYILESALDDSDLLSDYEVRQLAPGDVLVVDLLTLDIEISKKSRRSKDVVAPNVVLTSFKKWEDVNMRDEERRAHMKRCSKAVFCETMPYIKFDEAGVSNYSNAYSGVGLGNESELEAILSKHRKSDGSPDCLVAFSGGRDSSYGLYLLKEKWGMNPIAYTYDWGMVTGLARRNQARICGKLGVEHIWVSADIRKKRRNIRLNLNAWLKKPHLGMLPLLIAGDKHFFYYANRLMKQTGIDLMVFCSNHYEKTYFKSGFCGIAPDLVYKEKPSELGVAKKLQMAGFYGQQFACNPSYLNSSLADTASAAYSYYVMKTDFVRPFNYYHWDEKEVEAVLQSEFGWERAEDTPTTWRIGDGTAAFYNYVYHTVAGFTESDTFRSNQILDGAISREEALGFVNAENMPRWDSLREYLNVVGVGFDEALKVIHGIPKLY